METTSLDVARQLVKGAGAPLEACRDRVARAVVDSVVPAGILLCTAFGGSSKRLPLRPAHSFALVIR